ncbi:TetR/AcrR family transcriptional regulator [Paenibacillus segetis]|uniref:HTH tetR-type domain-containing protein n=1 Tax=Paenibacillus segetis TaxID=1325360 RepID=A0ABQ1YQS5_9BACL|nr:TetR family transcriptional regulator [Paenibacillus segetis]GGH35222.1 hypothetical protein GCM10008013_41410 [Paenibacillus segetis]
MYTGENPKALLSIQLLSNALMEELDSKKYENITIKDICRTADVSRQTFYNIFNTKDELLRLCIKDIFEEIMKKRSSEEHMDAKTSLSIFFETFYSKKSFMDIIVKSNLEYIMIEELMLSITNLAQISDTEGIVSHMDYILAFYSGGLAQYLFHWCKDPNRISLEELIQVLSELRVPFITS